MPPEVVSPDEPDEPVVPLEPEVVGVGFCGSCDDEQPAQMENRESVTAAQIVFIETSRVTGGTEVFCHAVGGTASATSEAAFAKRRL